jgi:hypothetical protein
MLEVRKNDAAVCSKESKMIRRVAHCCDKEASEEMLLLTLGKASEWLLTLLPVFTLRCYEHAQRKRENNAPQN